MASEADSAASFIENLMNSRNRNFPLLLPFIIALSNSTTSVQESTDPNQETQESTTPFENLERIVLVNPLTQGMVVLENSAFSSSSSNFESFMNGCFGQPPASKSSIEALQSVEIEKGGDCVVCLDEWDVGSVVKEMPCKHRFHGECIEKWLKIHGTCPVCRYKMPEEDDENLNSKNENNNNNNRGGRREIWMSFSFGNDRRSDENSQTENDHDHAPEA